MAYICCVQMNLCTLLCVSLPSLLYFRNHTSLKEVNVLLDSAVHKGRLIVNCEPEPQRGHIVSPPGFWNLALNHNLPPAAGIDSELLMLEAVAEPRVVGCVVLDLRGEGWVEGKERSGTGSAQERVAMVHSLQTWG